MGSVIRTVFGGSSSKSKSNNQAYGALNNAFSPMFSQGREGANSMSALLGGDATGLNRFKAMTGFDNQMLEGSRGITGNAAASGLLRSGSTAKALTSYGANLNNQFANNYMDRLMGQANLGLQAGNVVSGAGAQSTASSVSYSGGLGKFLGSAMVAASDVRLKENVTRIGELDNGLNVYTFEYKDKKYGEGKHVGVMAQEVKELQPGALGPKTEDGFMTVDYSKIEGLDSYGI